MLNPQWLLSFQTLHELGSFTRAAERLGLTQAAVSQHVRQLEARLGPLLVRRPRLEATPAGKALLDYCRELQQADRRLRQRLDDAQAPDGEFGLICPGSVGLFLYPLLLDLQREHPGLVVRQRFAPDDEVRQAVLAQQYELGLLTLRPDDPRLVSRPFLKEALELVVPCDAVVDGWEDLIRLGFIDHPDGRAMAGRLLSRRFPGHPGLDSLPVRGFSNQIGLLLEPVARGLGFTVLPHYARSAFRAPEAVRVLDGEPAVVDTLWLVHRAEWPLSGRAQRVLALLEPRVSAALEAVDAEGHGR